ncbi:hypothetical protein DV515_00010255, partial [Chloebia gouldiae]
MLREAGVRQEWLEEGRSSFTAIIPLFGVAGTGLTVSCISWWCLILKVLPVKDCSLWSGAQILPATGEEQRTEITMTLSYSSSKSLKGTLRKVFKNILSVSGEEGKSGEEQKSGFVGRPPIKMSSILESRINPKQTPKYAFVDSCIM